MKKCVDAVRYGLETLGISSDRLFHLIKTSKGYDGDNYERWLASKIIDISEEDGVGFSQLLVKKFHILTALSEEDGLEISEGYLKLLSKLLGISNREAYTVGFKGYEFFEENRKLDDFDWFTGVDYDAENTFFSNLLPVDLKEKVINGEFPFIFKIGLDSVGKKSELLGDAKNRCVPIKYFGSLLLYRMCLLFDVFGSSETKFVFVCPVEFLYDDDNRVLFKELLSRYQISGYDVSDLNPYLSEHAICVCEARKSNEMDYVALKKLSDISNGGKVSSKEKIYTKSDKKMIDFLREKYESKDGDNWGYLKFGKTLSIVKEKKGSDIYIPITGSNLKEIIGFYGMYKSNEGNGYFTDLNILTTGNPTYMDMVYNCIPLILFDYDSDYVIGESKFTITSDEMSRIIENSEVSASFEAKELMNIGKVYLDKVGDKANGLTFHEVRKSVSNDKYDRIYYNAVDNLKKYICSTYKGLY